MKYIIYVKNQLNNLINIYELKDSYKYDSIKNEFIYKNGNIENHNLNLLSALYNDLENTKNSLKQYKCLGKDQDGIYFLVRIKKEEDLNLNNFIILEQDSKFYKKAERKYHKYIKSIEKNKTKAIASAVVAQLEKKDLIIVLIELILFGISIYLSIKDKFVNPEGSKSFLEVLSTMSIFLVSIFVILLQSIETIIKKIHIGLEFRTNCDTACLVEGEEKKDIIKKVTNNLSSKYQNYQVMNFNNAECFLYSDFENHNLDYYGTNLRVVLEKYKIRLSDDSRKALAYIIDSKLKQDKSIFNGKLLGINSDLNFENLNAVHVKKVRYHNYVSTDEMIFKNVSIPTCQNDLICGTDLTLNPLTKGLRDIENSHLTNLIGINLILELHLKNKIYYLINRQSMFNDVNGSRYVPSSSGSLDQEDFVTLKKLKLTSFKDLLKIGMLRELNEESYILINNDFSNELNLKIKEFKLLGFSRLLSKAGKPDFFGKLVIELESIADIYKILDNYDLSQNKYLGNLKYELETNRMLIIEQEELFNNFPKENDLSFQLSYLIYLLKNE